MPWFLPDGEHLLFVSAEWKDTEASAAPCATDLAPGTIRKILAEPTEGRYMEPGMLLFVRGGQIMAQPFDEKGLRLSGEPIAIARRVHFNEYRFTGNWAADPAGPLAFERSVTPPAQLTWFDLDGKELG
jgi:hypothetical protein